MFRQRYMPRTRPAARLSNRDGWGALTDAHNNLGGWMQRAGYRTAWRGKVIQGYQESIGDPSRAAPGLDAERRTTTDDRQLTRTPFS
jgi:hypothetical protein